MKKIKICRCVSGVFYIKQRLLQFRNNDDYISDDDIVSLFMGLMRIIRTSAEIEAEQRLSSKIENLTRELVKYKSIIKNK